MEPDDLTHSLTWATIEIGRQSERQNRKCRQRPTRRGEMAATKRKRRGGLEVQAKKPKRSSKDAGQPAKQADVAKEAEEENRDRIPGPVCKVRGPTPEVGVGALTHLWATEAAK